MKFYGLALCRPSSNLFCLGTIAGSEESVGYDFFSSSRHSDNSLGQLQLPAQHWASLFVWPSHCCAAGTLSWCHVVYQLHLGTLFSVEGERYKRVDLTSSREPKLVGWSQGGLLLGPVDGNPRHDGTSRSEPGLPLCSRDMCPHSHYCTAYPYTNFSNSSCRTWPCSPCTTLSVLRVRTELLKDFFYRKKAIEKFSKEH